MEKEIDLIQSCISRMAANSFEIKKWTVGLISVSAVLLRSSQYGALEIISLEMVILVFWGLDGFFLKTERLYRIKYKWVIKNRINGKKEYLYDLNPYNPNTVLDEDKKEFNSVNVIKSMFSKTLFLFYLIIMILFGVMCSFHP